MKKSVIKKIICLLLAVALSTPCLVFAKPMASDLAISDSRVLSGWPSGPSVSAASAYAIEVGSGQVLYAKDENSKRFPASITKVMTGLLVVENCNLDDMVTFSQEAINRVDITGANGNYKAGEKMTVRQCLYALMLESINECGEVLAEHVAGSTEAFADMMNARAEELGCTNTHFRNPHGLNDDEHLTSAHDMALIMWAAVLNEELLEVMSTKNYTIPKADGTEGHDLTNHHKMMIPGTNYYYSKVVAGKTGYTSDAGNTLVTYGESNGVRVVVVVLKEGKAEDAYQDTESILEYTFSNFEYKDLSNEFNGIIAGIEMEAPYKFVVDGGAGVLLPKNFAEVSLDYETRSENDEANVVGNILIKSGESLLATKKIVFEVATEAVDDEENAENTVILAESETESEENSGGGFWSTVFSVVKIILIVFLIIILLVFIYWFVIQLLKRNRARKKREYLAKRKRIDNIRKLRQEKDEG